MTTDGAKRGGGIEKQSGSAASKSRQADQCPTKRFWQHSTVRGMRGTISHAPTHIPILEPSGAFYLHMLITLLIA
jgi:hypothetical protein